jgi:hypothetical protein
LTPCNPVMIVDYSMPQIINNSSHCVRISLIVITDFAPW